MSVRNFDALFHPEAIALIGASERPHSAGALLARNLFGARFDGLIMPVNPRRRSIEGVLTYPDVASLPVTPDLAVIATPPDTVPGLIDELGRRGARAAVIISGLDGSSPERQAALAKASLEAAKPHLMRLVGPNCVGIQVPGRGINASFAHVISRPGDIAFVTQSGAIATAVLDWAVARGIGFSHGVSLGDMIDVDVGDMLDHLATDQDARAILLYVETVTSARKFMSAARSAARAKPVIVVKAGRHAERAERCNSHTAAMVAADAVHSAAFRRAGMLRVVDLDELFDAVETLGRGRPVEGERLAIVGNAGSIGLLATDRLLDLGGRLATLSPATIARLDAALPAGAVRGNPLDLMGDADGTRYAAALDALMADPEVDAVLALHGPTPFATAESVATSVLGTLERPAKPVVTSWVGEADAEPARRLFQERGVPTYATPDKAVRGFMHMVRYRRNQAMLMQTPASIPEEFPTDTARARAVVEKALAEGRGQLDEAEGAELLAAYGLRTVETRRVPADPMAAGRAASDIGFPVALKVLSRDVARRTDAGGVMLNLETAEVVRAAAEAMLERARRARPETRIDGFSVQPMVRPAVGYETIAGMVEDPLFGPVLLFGQGGAAVEEIDDTTIALPPLNMTLAREMIGRTRLFRLLRGYRDRPAVALDELALALLKLSQLITDVAEIAELDVNPLLVDPEGVIALGARVRVAPARRPGPERLAIRPYPRELESTVALRDGREVLLRPVRPEDEPMFHRFFGRLSPEDVRMRFFMPMKSLPAYLAARLTQIDYDREMALIATAPASNGTDPELLGVVRIAADPDNFGAEYAVIVRTDQKRCGLGRLLMTRVIDYARGRGVTEVFGDVLRENDAMLALCRKLGFTVQSNRGDPQVVRVRLKLS